MDLKELKKILDDSSHSLQSGKSLEEERAISEDRLILLKEKKENLVKNHHFQKKELKKAKSLEQEIEKITQEIADLKINISKIDRELDDLGEDQEKVLYRTKNEIIEMIQKKFPNASEELLLLEKKKIFQKQKINELSATKKALLPFYHSLKEGVSFKKRRKIFDFLFGRGPKVHMANAIHEAALKGEKIKNLENDFFRKMIHEFLKEAEKRWNSALYSEKYFIFFNKFQAAFHKLEKEIADLDEEIEIREKDIQKWIDKYCE